MLNNFSQHQLTLCKRGVFWCAFGLVCVALFIPLDGTPSELPIDKLVHFGFFLILAWSGYIAYPQRMALFVWLVVFAVLSEIIQGVSGLRSFDWYDIAADWLGIAVVYCWVVKYRA